MPLARKLGPLDATMIVVSGIIGSGIFINPYLVAQKVETPFLSLAVWVIGGVIALCGAFVFAELATVLPRAGGQYAFFREAFHPLVGFLHGWSLLFIIQSGATAAVAVTCGGYLARLTGLPDAAVKPVSIALLLALVVLHGTGIKPGAIVINVITIGKTLAIAALVLGAFLIAGRSGLTFEPLIPPRLHGPGLISALFAGLVPAMFTYGGWQNANFVVEEIRDPERNLPRAILLGVGIVIAVYVSSNIAYVHVLSAPVLAATHTPAADLAREVFGPRGADALSVLVIISTFGFLNLALMTAPRVYYAMARDGLFFETVARVSPRSHVPVAAIATQGVLAALFTLTNAYASLVDYAVFADWVFFALAGVALIVFRRTRPDAPRPYRAPLYPVLPLVFVIAGFGIVANSFVDNPPNALICSAIIAAGVPVYFAWRGWRGRRDVR
ncbi:MAG TPA: amino acid permease [Kofleriaceae bacterium]|jgi:APA family basic amino acid/polyamine antiporter|nr:amino acid permease [Kofleriaceae bacterium]